MERKREGVKAALIGNRLFVLTYFKSYDSERSDSCVGSTQDIVLLLLFAIVQTE